MTQTSELKRYRADFITECPEQLYWLAKRIGGRKLSEQGHPDPNRQP